MTQGQFLSGVLQVWIQSFPSPRLVASPRLKNLVCPRGRIIGFIPFPRVLELCEMQSVRSRIWTRVAVSISSDDNHYTTSTNFHDDEPIVIFSSLLYLLEAILDRWPNLIRMHRTGNMDIDVKILLDLICQFFAYWIACILRLQRIQNIFEVFETFQYFFSCDRFSVFPLLNEVCCWGKMNFNAISLGFVPLWW